MADDIARSGAAEPLPGSAGPLDIAMDAERHDPAPENPARRLLEAQNRLVLEQVGLAKNERFRNRIKAVRDLSIAGLALALLLGVGAVVWTARSAQGLIVEPLRAPPELAAQGLDGTVLAARLLDRLAAMQAGTDSSRAPGAYANNWGDDLEVDIPQTGVSLAELHRLLRRSLGRETRISGDVVRTAQGLALTTRVGSAPGVTVTGPPEEMDRLLDRAGEAIYRQSQPYRYAVWLARNDENGSANEAVLRELSTSPSKTERLWAYVGQSVNALLRDDFEQAEALALEGLDLDPTFHKLRWNLVDAQERMGHDEAALATRRIVVKRHARRDPRVTDAARLQVLHGLRGEIAILLGDYGTALDQALIQSRSTEYSGSASSARYEAAIAAAMLHDIARSRRLSAAAERSVTGPRPTGSVASRLTEAIMLEDWAAVRALAPEALAQTEYTPGQAAAFVWPMLAVAQARAGDVAAAEALIARTRRDCYQCLVARGQIAAAKGEYATAERWFADAARRGPTLPLAHYRWGEARLARGELDGAIRLFREAQRRGPRWADPLKFEGDALARQGRHRDAVRRYAAAAERAPRWGALHLAWGRSLEATGRRDEARARYELAARLDLSATDRAAVQRLLARRG